MKRMEIKVIKKKNKMTYKMQMNRMITTIYLIQISCNLTKMKKKEKKTNKKLMEKTRMLRI